MSSEEGTARSFARLASKKLAFEHVVPGGEKRTVNVQEYRGTVPAGHPLLRSIGSLHLMAAAESDEPFVQQLMKQRTRPFELSSRTPRTFTAGYGGNTVESGQHSARVPAGYTVQPAAVSYGGKPAGSYAAQPATYTVQSAGGYGGQPATYTVQPAGSYGGQPAGQVPAGYTVQPAAVSYGGKPAGSYAAQPATYSVQSAGSYGGQPPRVRAHSSSRSGQPIANGFHFNGAYDGEGQRTPNLWNSQQETIFHKDGVKSVSQSANVPGPYRQIYGKIPSNQPEQQPGQYGNQYPTGLTYDASTYGGTVARVQNEIREDFNSNRGGMTVQRKSHGCCNSRNDDLIPDGSMRGAATRGGSIPGGSMRDNPTAVEVPTEFYDHSNGDLDDPKPLSSRVVPTFIYEPDVEQPKRRAPKCC